MGILSRLLTHGWSIILRLARLLTVCALFSGCVGCGPFPTPIPHEHQKFYIATYNMKSHWTINGVSWRQRVDNFVSDVVVPYRPMIIALQELYLKKDGSCLANDECGEDIHEGEYLEYLLDRIEQKTGGVQYNVANSLRVHHAIVDLAEEWEGDAVIYDSAQVSLVPFHGDTAFGRECENWYQKRLQDEKNDCLPLGDPGPKVSKSVFEFPIGSGYHILFYNTHCAAEDVDEVDDKVFEFMKAGQQGFQGSRYPPILVGDLNTWATPGIQEYFVDPIEGNHIDNLLFGTYENQKWEFEGLWWFPNSGHGPIALSQDTFNPNGHVYSDHPVMVAELLY